MAKAAFTAAILLPYSRRGEDVHARPFDEHPEFLGAFWPGTHVQRQNLAPGILSSFLINVPARQVGKNQEMSDTLFLPLLPFGVFNFQRAGKGLAAGKIEFDLV